MSKRFNPIPRFAGTVVHGHGRGKILGFPTLNLSTDEPLPVENGVYAVRVHFPSAISSIPAISGVMHVGPRPTFHESDRSIEIHLLDFKGDVSPDQVEVEILGYLRKVRSFDSPEALKKQIDKDMMRARTFF